MTETRMPCGHLQADLVEVVHEHRIVPDVQGGEVKTYCRSCKQQAEAVAQARLDTLEQLRMECTNLLVMAHRQDEKGIVETPQKEWTPYQGKALAYQHIIDRCIELERAVKEAGR